MKKMKRCGACGKQLKTNEEWLEHRKICKMVKTLSPVLETYEKTLTTMGVNQVTAKEIAHTLEECDEDKTTT